MNELTERPCVQMRTTVAFRVANIAFTREVLLPLPLPRGTQNSGTKDPQQNIHLLYYQR